MPVEAELARPRFPVAVGPRQALTAALGADQLHESGVVDHPDVVMAFDVGPVGDPLEHAHDRVEAPDEAVAIAGRTDQPPASQLPHAVRDSERRLVRLHGTVAVVNQLLTVLEDLSPRSVQPADDRQLRIEGLDLADDYSRRRPNDEVDLALLPTLACGDVRVQRCADAAAAEILAEPSDKARLVVIDEIAPQEQGDRGLC